MPDTKTRSVALEHLVMALDRTLTTLDPGRGAQRMAADVRQALTEALASLSAARRALALRGGVAPTGGPEGFLEGLEALSRWLRAYVGTLAAVPGSERFSVEVPYLKIRGFRDEALEERLRSSTLPPSTVAAAPAPTPARPGARGTPSSGRQRSPSLRKRKGR